MRWSYKIVHYDYKKEGLLGGTFLDETEIEQSMNEFGHAGWELISLLEVQDGLMATFKQPLEAPPLQRTRPEGEAGQEERTVPRYVRPDRGQKTTISRGVTGVGKETVDEEDQPLEDTPLPSRTSRLPRTIEEKKRSTGDEGNSGGVGSIRIE
jgi:hypothetical protein